MFKQKIKSARLFKEDEMYYLDLRYEIENDKEIGEYHIPKVRLPIETAALMIDCIDDNLCENDIYVHIPSSKLLCFKGDVSFPHTLSDIIYDVKYGHHIIKDKTTPVELTMDEIEKKLGYKVKIINKGE